MITNSSLSDQDFAGAIIERKDGKMLFQLRDNKKTTVNPNTWWIFGGGVETNETPMETVIRELKEEINLDVNKKDLKLIHKEQLKTKKVYLYKIKFNEKTPPLKLKEGKSMRFMSKQEILKKTNVTTVLRRFLSTNYP
ncbi:MAG: NUDIX domain-containing protein [Nanoarchaeota archaeon]|nr:NUDIX domain-containing protein [Nanoarchaeota archaeon]